MSEDAREWLLNVVRSRSFLRRYPLYAALLASFDPIVDPAVRVMGVSLAGRRIRLHVNVDFFRREPRALEGVLLHESHHVVLGHLTMQKFHEAAHPDLMELAMEMSANEHIRAPLPGCPVRWEQFAVLGLRGGQSTLERYRALRRAREEHGVRFPKLRCVDDHLRVGVGAVHAPSSPAHPQASWRLGRILDNVRAVTPHAAPGQCNPSRLLAGRATGHWVEWLRSEGEVPLSYVDWRKALLPFVSHSRERSFSYTRPNRRLPNWVGVVPGRHRRRTDRRPKILVALDTSGSMTHPELHEIARQLERICHLANVTVVECDSQVQRVYPFRGRLDRVQGRGGTDLRPVFERALLAREGPDGIVYFTDGDGPYPDRPPPVPTLWVLTKPEEFSCPWGRRARLSVGTAGNGNPDIPLSAGG